MTLQQTISRFALAAMLLLACSARADTVKLQAGDMAPDIIGKSADGDVVRISDHAGKVVVVSFWATWCAYCIKELPILENLQNSSVREHIRVIAVNTEDRDVFRDTRRKMKNFKMTQIYDPRSVGQTAYGVSGIPHMVIIGRDGRILKVYRGYGEEMLDSIVENINIAVQAPIPAPATAASAPVAGAH